ncbi:hypothetical protein KJY78_06430, partial [Canibacter sp. lx-45]|nr:hypothetical protein [Canibacter zhuwentaonis]
VTITVTVSAASVANGGKAARVRKTAENVSVYVLLPQADEGFVNTAQTKQPECTPSGGAKCPDAGSWEHEEVTNSLSATAPSIPAGGKLVFKITGQAGVQKNIQSGEILTVANNDALSDASFTVKKENVSVTALFDALNGSNAWTGDVKVTGTLKCTVPGDKGVDQSFEKTFRVNGDDASDDSGQLQWQKASNVVKGSTCSVTVTNVTVPVGWQLEYTSPVVKRVLQDDILDVPLKVTPAAEISTKTSVDKDKESYLPGDTVRITSTVNVTGNEARNVSVYMFLPSAGEGFIHTGELKPQCTATGNAKCPTDDKWTYSQIGSSSGYFTTVVESIPAGGSLVFTVTGQAGLQSKPQNTDRILTGVSVTPPVQGVNTMTVVNAKTDNNYHGTSFSVKEENATVTGVFNLTESEENLSAEVTVSGTLTCIVPGKDGDYINSQFTQVLQFPNSNTAKKVLSESVLKGSTCTVTVNNVQVPEGWEWNLPNPVVQKVTENTEVQVAVDALPPAPKPAPEQKPAPSEPAPSEPAPAPESETETEMETAPETAPSEPEQEPAPSPAPAPESETESEPVPPVMPEQPAPSVPVVPETPVAPESVAPV